MHAVPRASDTARSECGLIKPPALEAALRAETPKAYLNLDALAAGYKMAAEGVAASDRPAFAATRGRSNEPRRSLKPARFGHRPYLTPWTTLTSTGPPGP